MLVGDYVPFVDVTSLKHLQLSHYNLVERYHHKVLIKHINVCMTFSSNIGHAILPIHNNTLSFSAFRQNLMINKDKTQRLDNRETNALLINPILYCQIATPPTTFLVFFCLGDHKSAADYPAVFAPSFSILFSLVLLLLSLLLVATLIVVELVETPPSILLFLVLYEFSNSCNALIKCWYSESSKILQSGTGGCFIF